MSLHRFNITKPRDGLENKSVKEKMEVKQEYHDQKKYNVFKATPKESVLSLLIVLANDKFKE